MTEKRHALVVEDEPLVRRTLGRIAKWIGYEVSTAGNANEGVAMLDEGAYDLIITDLRMPGMSGLEVARRATELESDPVVVVVSGFITPEEEGNIVGIGASLLRKPFDADEAKHLIEEAVRLKSAPPPPPA